MDNNRSITEIKDELTITGSKDSFIEDIEINKKLIQKRIKKGIKEEKIVVGKYTNTKVSIFYMDEICDKKLVKNIMQKLKNINIDGILDSSYLKHSLEEEQNLFPTIMATERPDKASMALLEGKVLILVDNSPYVLIIPTLFLDFFHTPDDYYQKAYNITIIRIIRVFAFIIAIYLPGIYLATTTRDYYLLPKSLLLMLKAGRTYVPFPAYIEAIIMMISFEILRESDIRMSSTTSSSISILGGLILGDAAVSAGIVSPIMIIIIAISSIAGLIFNSIEFVNTIRIYKLIILLLSTLLGIAGVLLGYIIMIQNIKNTRIFGYEYYSKKSIEKGDAIIKTNKKIKTRNSYLTKNKIRGNYK